MIHFGIGVILSVGIKVDTKLYGGVWLDENLPWSSSKGSLMMLPPA